MKKKTKRIWRIGELLKLKMKKIADMQEKLQHRINEDTEINLPAELIVMEYLEKDGGTCPKCGKPWRKIEVQNRFADFHYFDPVCSCYVRCPKCKNSLHREQAVIGVVKKCPDCGHQLVKENKKDKQVKKYSEQYAKGRRQ